MDRMRAMFKEEEFWLCWILWSGWMADFLLREMWQFFEKKGSELNRTMKASGSMTASRKHAFIRRERTHHSMRWTTVDSLPRRTVTCTIEGPKRSLDGGKMSSTKTGRRGTSSWTWRQFWGITNLAISKGTRWWCFGGIEDRERHHFSRNKEGRIQFLSKLIDPYLWSTLNPFLLQCHCCYRLTTQRSPEMVSDQSLLFTKTVILRFQWVLCLPLLTEVVHSQSTLLST